MAAPIRSSYKLVQGALQQQIRNGNTNALRKNSVASLPSASYYPACRFLSSDTKDELYRQITIEVKGHDPAVLKSYQEFTTMAARELNVNIDRILDPPKIITRRSLLKSVFVHKKHFHQYETRTHYKIFELKHLTGSTASTFLEYIQRNLPEGVAMKVTKHQLHPFPSHLKPPEAAKNQSETSPSSISSSLPSS